ncbi:hypothetical protein [Chryseobacterium caseinilyticum]|uniref:Phage integrase SAM-like domain-containing protein n=1 Tax=Chryseobacterium caseinilyticum TaxID=2771428 RepID=A0ABR8Z865_9FLAO|nr:hypothetical protein [Chryseobacterium caseinilyticum]MBD8081115.1 hypothetical protein [Chryseobacterium caseinilyticum]
MYCNIIRLKPIEVPGYLISFILKECDGVSMLKNGGEYKQILIEPKSVLGHFLNSRHKKPADLEAFKEYCLTIYSNRKGEKKVVSTDIINLYNSSEFSVDWSFDDIEAFYKMLDSFFRTYFVFFVRGYCKGSSSRRKIKEAINVFCDMYDLYEFGYSYNTMRIMYFRYTNNGVMSLFQNNNSLNFGFFGVT